MHKIRCGGEEIARASERATAAAAERDLIIMCVLYTVEKAAVT